MADNLIPGLDGDLPPNRGHLPDSLQVKASNGATVGYGSHQVRQGELENPTAVHSKVCSGLYLEKSVPRRPYPSNQRMCFAVLYHL